MTQPNKQGAKLPTLRFPEFQDNWAVKKGSLVILVHS